MNHFFRYTLTFLITSVAVIQFIQVVARYIFAVPLLGLEEILVYPTLWLYMLGSVNASRTNTQITANVLDIFIKTEKGQLRLNCVSLFCSLVVACWLTYWAFGYENYARKMWKHSPTLYFPMYFAEVALFLGLVFMTWYTFVHLARTAALLHRIPGPDGGGK